MSTLTLSLFALLSCAADPVLESAPPLAPEPVATTPSPIDARALYEECGPAVEGPSSVDECSSDAECVAVGCSGEVCVSKKTADAGLASGCLERPCHAVLDVCGCQAGVCTWSLKGTP